MKVYFYIIDKTFKSEIKMGNNGTIPIVGKGSLMVRTMKGEKTKIQNGDTKCMFCPRYEAQFDECQTTHSKLLQGVDGK